MKTTAQLLGFQGTIHNSLQWLLSKIMPSKAESTYNDRIFRGGGITAVNLLTPPVTLAWAGTAEHSRAP